jgi:ADP-glucose pyrophosphorylase
MTEIINDASLHRVLINSLSLRYEELTRNMDYLAAERRYIREMSPNDTESLQKNQNTHDKYHQEAVLIVSLQHYYKQNPKK